MRRFSGWWPSVLSPLGLAVTSMASAGTVATATVTETGNKATPDGASASDDDTAGACVRLVPDLRILDRKTLASFSSRLVDQASEGSKSCRAAVKDDIDSPFSQRLVTALAALPESAPEARDIARKGASAGSAEARNLYASMLSNGIGGPVNDVQAAIYFHLAAAGGVSAAMFNYGLARWYGKGLPVDRRDAVTWLERAIAKGDAEAMSFLGVRLILGDGVIADRDRGVELLSQAIEKDGLRSTADASAAYDYLGSLSESRDPDAPASPALVADDGNRIAMIERATKATKDEAAALLDKASNPIEPRERLAAWLTRISVVFDDSDEAVYRKLLAYRGLLLDRPGVDVSPYIDRVEARLRDQAEPARADGIDVASQDLAELWQQSVSACAASPIKMESYLTCAWNKAVAQLLWTRGWCPTGAGEHAWERCEP